jgi:hypothetical protein
MLKRLFPSVLGLLLMVGIPASLFAKGRTVRITIKGLDLESPIDITDPKILANFNVWTGPGTSSNGRTGTANAGKGLIVDWSQGTISPPPKGLPLYEVFFYADFGNQEEKQVYVVSYEYDPSTQHGYVYLPGKGDKWWRLNVSSIFRGLEGNWFSAWSAWEDVARPLIEKAKVAASTPPSA